MDIAFIVTDQQATHEGVVRPLVNFAKALQGKHRFTFLLLDCSTRFIELLASKSAQVIVCENKSILIQQAAHLNPQLVLSDDDLKRLKLAQEVKKATKAKTAVYVQILYGSHAIAECFDLSSLSLKQKLVFKFIKHLPFSFFSGKYSKLLGASDLVVANSKVTATFLHSLYNVNVTGIVYPSVDTNVFQPSNQTRGKEIIIYLGSHLGDTKQAFVEQILETVQGKGYAINLFGNSKMASSVTKKSNSTIRYRSNLSDAELAQMYSQSKLTVCLQKWEQFGYVPVESISCGTPVLAFNCMGFQETITPSTGWLANNEEEFIQTLQEAINKPLMPLINNAAENFSLAASGKTFEALLEKYFNAKT